MTNRLLALFAVATLLAPTYAANFDWPQWRGPNRDDISKETGLMKKWPAEGPKRVWLFENAGHGYSSPAIANGKFFTMGTRDNSETMLALDANTGKELWSTPLGDIYKEQRGDGPRSGPSVDGDRVYGMTGKGLIACLNVADGKLVWKQDLLQLGGRINKWGYTESVLVDGDQVICTPGGQQGAVAALDKKTGKVIWQTKDFTDIADYSSVVKATINGTPQYVQLTQKSVVGISPKDGKILWRTTFPGATAVITTPIVRDNFVYVAADYGVGCKMFKVTPDNQTETVYENKVMKNHHGGVVLVGDHLYGYSGNQGWVCQDFKTGAEVWINKGLGKGAVAYADGMLYCLDENTGTVALVEAVPTGWNEASRFKLEPQSKIRSPAGRFWTHPVVSNGRLYLRDQEYIYCFEIKPSVG